MKLTNFVLVTSSTACFLGFYHIAERNGEISEGGISWPEAAARMMNAFGHGKKLYYYMIICLYFSTFLMLEA